MKRHHQNDLDVERLERLPRRSTRRTTVKNRAATNLCEYCTSIQISKTECGYVPLDLIYTRNAGDIIQAARQRNCELCHFLILYLRWRVAKEVQIKDDTLISLRKCCNADHSRVPGHAGPTSWPTQVELRVGDDWNGPPSVTKFDICRCIPNPMGNILGVFRGSYPEPHPYGGYDGQRYLPRIVNSDPLSEATIGLVKGWLSSCRRNHTCKRQRPRPLLTRVVDIRTRKPKVIDSEGLSGRYVALSHCWGSTEDTFSTTSQNIAQRKSVGLEIAQLPQNFQDAITFTRRLGYDYLWIDSLCILQQNLQDWRHEAGRMAGYYNNAIITLAIADAANCQVGFLQKRRQHYSPPISGNRGQFFYFRETLPSERDLTICSAISKRAWTLQERLLSPRVVHFTRDQVLWHCRDTEWAEGYVYDRFRKAMGPHYTYAGRFIDSSNDNPYQHFNRLKVGDKDPFDSNFATETWYSCVSEFTTRSITQASDKLPAIAGLANMFSKPELGQYIAGLWEQDLFRGLAWKRVDLADNSSDRATPHIVQKARRNLTATEFELPLVYRAPSWSWASVNGPVEVDRCLGPGSLYAQASPTQYEIDHWTMNYGPSLVSCHLLHSTDSPFVDTLEGSSITVRGFCRKLWATSVKPTSDFNVGGPLIDKIIFDDMRLKEKYLCLTTPDALDQSWEELLLFQICKQFARDRLVSALLLEKMQNIDGFKRIGLVELACYNLCEIPGLPLTESYQPHSHPLEARYSKFFHRKKLYETKEWQKDRWTEGTLNLF